MNLKESCDSATEIDDIIATAPAYMLDSRSYYYSQYPGVSIVYNPAKFVNTVSLREITTPSPTYVAGFGGSMLLTWIGLNCTVKRTVDTSYTLHLKVVDGPHLFENQHREIFTYVPPQISCFEPLHVRRFTTCDKVDTGQKVHVRVHNEHNVELLALFSTWNNCS